MTLAEVRAQATVTVGSSRTWPDPIGYMSVTLEDADFLYALVRVIRPLSVVEIGSGVGISGLFIAEALLDNGKGFLHTFEERPEFCAQAAHRLAGYPAKVSSGSSPNPARSDADMVFIDHGGLRAATIEAWLTSGFKGLVVIHDASTRGFENAEEHGIGVHLRGQDGFWIGTAR